ncbi:hypothetical protein CEXT_529911 [Caerostris extrusa]|uniref:Uncharacterized protein n=1 Tax=Caerostris extrusa TaxID=172846 RepID=A0AAV4QTE3_CAEEX|nr:hypothetical protein CEXT_529911 [Caerostris extrusa]
MSALQRQMGERRRQWGSWGNVVDGGSLGRYCGHYRGGDQSHQDQEPRRRRTRAPSPVPVTEAWAVKRAAQKITT